MNGYNTAYFAPGGPGFIPYAPPTPPAPVYTGMDPTIYATDTPALIPTQEPEPFEWYNVQAPLDLTGLNFPAETGMTSPAPIGAPSYDWQAPLDLGGLTFSTIPATPSIFPSAVPELDLEGLVFPAVAPVPAIIQDPATEWFNWQAPLDVEGLKFAPEPKTGILESITGFAGDVVKTIVDTGKFILDHLDVGVSYQGQFGDASKGISYSEMLSSALGSMLGSASPTVVAIPSSGGTPSMRTSVSTAGSPPMTEDERLMIEAMQQGQSDTGRFIIYGGLAYLAYQFMSKKG